MSEKSAVRKEKAPVRRRLISPKKSPTPSTSKHQRPSTEVIPIASPLPDGEEKEKEEKLTNIEIIENAYYAVDYCDTYYVGRVIKVGKRDVFMTFLRRLPGGEYTWPTKRDEDRVTSAQIFDGPFYPEGTLPFSFPVDFHKLWMKFIKYKKSLAS